MIEHCSIRDNGSVAHAGEVIAAMVSTAKIGILQSLSHSGGSGARCDNRQANILKTDPPWQAAKDAILTCMPHRWSRTCEILETL